LTASGENIPKTVIVQVYKGSNAKQVKLKGYETIELYGSGKGIPNDKIERLFDHLFMEEALEKFNVWNREWSNAYVKVRLPPSFLRAVHFKLFYSLARERTNS
jgi:superfamily II DNA helicase RecQ